MAIDADEGKLEIMKAKLVFFKKILCTLNNNIGSGVIYTLLNFFIVWNFHNSEVTIFTLHKVYRIEKKKNSFPSNFVEVSLDDKQQNNC